MNRFITNTYDYMNGIALAEDLQAAEIIVNQIHRFTMHPPKTETRMEDTLLTRSLVYRRNQNFLKLILAVCFITTNALELLLPLPLASAEIIVGM